MANEGLDPGAPILEVVLLAAEPLGLDHGLHHRVPVEVDEGAVSDYAARSLRLSALDDPLLLRVEAVRGHHARDNVEYAHFDQGGLALDQEPQLDQVALLEHDDVGFALPAHQDLLIVKLTRVLQLFLGHDAAFPPVLLLLVTGWHLVYPVLREGKLSSVIKAELEELVDRAIEDTGRRDLEVGDDGVVFADKFVQLLVAGDVDLIDQGLTLTIFPVV
mmetsp:Transcript_18481/g.31633  ORF Transcript_18481/g.31633 Transcript_18481/m.31633 type:complete len:218 (-) Transcript_18481:1053-1706(-)